MGTFVFRWTHPASEVYVTGTFDNWEKTEKLNKIGDAHEKEVTLPRTDERFYYKFVVDGNWVTDHTAPQDYDYAGNLNNVLEPHRIVKHAPNTAPAATTSTMSSTQQPIIPSKDLPGSYGDSKSPSSNDKSVASKSSMTETASRDLPGAFPETPAAELSNFFGKSTSSTTRDLPGQFVETLADEAKTFEVNPLPATAGSGNPIKLAAGEKVPHSSNLTSNTIASTVEDDKTLPGYKEEKEQALSITPIPSSTGPGNPIKSTPGESLPRSDFHPDAIKSTATTDKESYERGSSDFPQEQSFGIAPIPATAGAGNPINIAAGQSIPHHSALTSNTVQSTATTDKASYENASGSAPVLPPVATPEDGKFMGTGLAGGLLGAGTSTASSTKEIGGNSKNFIPESSLPMGSGNTDSYSASPFMQSTGPSSTTAQLAGAVPLEPRGARVPEIVKESQQAAGASPEASAVPSEVQEKSAFEKDLLSKVPQAPVTSDGTALHSEAPMKTATGVSAQEAAAAVGAATLAIGGAIGAAFYSAKDQVVAGVQGTPATTSTTTTSNNSTVPAIVKESQQTAGASPEASANPAEVQEKSALEREMLAKVPEAPVTSDGTVLHSESPMKTVTGVSASEAGAAVGGAALAIGGAIGAAAYSAKDKVVSGAQTASSSVANATRSTSLGPITDARDSSVSHSITSPSTSGLGPVVDNRTGSSSTSTSRKTTSALGPITDARDSSLSHSIASPAVSGLGPIIDARSGSSNASTSNAPRKTTSALGPITDARDSSLSHSIKSPAVSGLGPIIDGRGQSSSPSSSSVPSKTTPGLGPITDARNSSINHTIATPSSSGLGPITDARSGSSNTSVPAMVKESQAAAHVDPEASAVPSEVQEKSAFEKDLLSKVPAAPVTSDGTALHSESPMKVATGVSAGEAATAVGAAAVAVGGAIGAGLLATKNKAVSSAQDASKQLPTSVQQTFGGSGATRDSTLTTDNAVPRQVTSSLSEAHQSPEAAAYREPVAEKRAMEKELLASVKPVDTKNATVSPTTSSRLGPIADGRDTAFDHSISSPTSSGLGVVHDAREMSSNAASGHATHGGVSATTLGMFRPDSAPAVPVSSVIEEPSFTTSTTSRQVDGSAPSALTSSSMAPVSSYTGSTSSAAAPTSSYTSATSSAAAPLSASSVPVSSSTMPASFSTAPASSSVAPTVDNKKSVATTSTLQPDATTSGTTVSPVDTTKPSSSSGSKTAALVGGGVGAAGATTAAAAAAAAYNKSAKSASTLPTSGADASNRLSTPAQANRQSLIASTPTPTDSRDVSPGTVSATRNQTAPVVTSGVQSATTTAQSGAPAPVPSSSEQPPSTPTKASGSRDSKYMESPSASSARSDKTNKRKSFFSKIKEKLKGSK